MRDLGTLGGTADSYAFGINEAGQVVGYSFMAGGLTASPCFHHRPRRDGHEGPWHFGRLLISYAYGINDAGQVVGTSDTDWRRHSMLSSPAPMGWV